MSLSSYFKVNVTFQKGAHKDSTYFCNVTLKCCNRKELTKEDIYQLLEQRFGKKFNEEDIKYEHERIAPYDHAKLHADGYENVTITISKKDSPEEIKDENHNQQESSKEIKIDRPASAH